MVLAKDYTGVDAGLKQKGHNNKDERSRRETAVSGNDNNEIENKTSHKSFRCFAIITAFVLSGMLIRFGLLTLLKVKATKAK